jgi:dihydrofolate reductase
MVIGGADVFHAAMAEADRFYLTLVHGAVTGDVRMALPEPEDWREVSKEPMPQSPQDQFPADFIVLDRKH